jgi:Protein of unknown function (DUF1353)
MTFRAPRARVLLGVCLTSIISIPTAFSQAPGSQLSCDVFGVPVSDVLNIRGGPSSKSPIVGTLNPTAREIRVSGVTQCHNPGKWVRTVSAIREEWILGDFLRDHDGAPWRTFRVTGVSASDGLQMRQDPKLNSPSLLRIPHDTSDILHSGRFAGPASQRWIEIIVDKSIGWVNAKYIAEIPERVRPGQSRFFGDVILSPLDDGINMETRARFGYIDGWGRIWEVPGNFKTDGASIPRPLWSIVGSPFTGKYRNAAIVHDRYCATRARSWQDTHLVFFEAMITAGVDRTVASIMYAAVRRFGPRWFANVTPNCWYTCTDGPHILEATVYPKFEEDDWQKIQSAVKKNVSISLKELEELADDLLAGAVDMDKAEAKAIMVGTIASLDGTMNIERLEGPAPYNWTWMWK